MNFFMELSPITQTLLATLFTWLVTALGAAIVLFFKSINRKVLDCMLGFGAGVMIAASFWSLLNPAIELCEELGSNNVWILPALGFFIGGVFMVVSDKFLDKYYFNTWKETNLIPKKDSLKRSMLLVSAVTIHNIPEGLAIGVAFGGVVAGVEGASIISALMLAVGVSNALV